MRKNELKAGFILVGSFVGGLVLVGVIEWLV